MRNTRRNIAVILADNSVDCILALGDGIERHAKDLRDMGFKVRVKYFPSWKAAEAYEARMRGNLSYV